LNLHPNQALQIETALMSMSSEFRSTPQDDPAGIPTTVIVCGHQSDGDCLFHVYQARHTATDIAAGHHYSAAASQARDASHTGALVSFDLSDAAGSQIQEVALTVCHARSQQVAAQILELDGLVIRSSEEAGLLHTQEWSLQTPTSDRMSHRCVEKMEAALTFVLQLYPCTAKDWQREVSFATCLLGYPQWLEAKLRTIRDTILMRGTRNALIEQLAL